eukprot:CAMPEP_0118959196 /NCGR_PEP_ID=MMETSP1169-20130426/63010_1 /TAXON_ID=36882 /ORGANISM="Pyramimonas obovata, Strain CCMP722" /LENGTH=35 /DNA_ID= /DNA_START= /DNA_END= /DNA_ORIENTATION=
MHLQAGEASAGAQALNEHGARACAGVPEGRIVWGV